MISPLRRMAQGAGILVSVLGLSVVGYRLAGWTWVDSIYMVGISVTTVGYREMGEMSDALKLFTLCVIVSGVTATGYILGGFVQLVTEGEIRRQMGQHRMTRDIEHISSHVVVCGFGRIGQLLCDELHRARRGFVVIEADPTRVAGAIKLGYLVVNGNATEEDALRQAGIERATSLVTALPGDSDNVFITLTARNLNRNLQIISRGEFPSTQKKLLQAGADRVVLPATIGAQRIAHMLTRPSVVEFLEIVAGRSTLDFEVDEFSVAAGSWLAGKTVQEAEARRKHGLLIVAVKREGQGMIFNPDADFALHPGDTVIVMGKSDDIARFRQAAGV